MTPSVTESVDPQDAPTPTTIYLVNSCVEYEGSWVLRGYTRREDAEAFAKLCNDHNDTYPECPDVDAPSLEWENYDTKLTKWEGDHPNPGGSTMESYVVSPVTIYTP